MINGKTVLGVILARAGSKRVPNKNLLPFRGRPLLSWTVDAAKQSAYLDNLILSTDIPIEALGDYAPPIVQRPAELATDDATSEDALRHAVSLHPADWVVLLQPTSPLRTVEDIDACIERAQLGNGCISTFHYKTNGAVYVATAEWLAEHEFSHLGLLKYEMEESHSLDIDEPEDFDK